MDFLHTGDFHFGGIPAIGKITPHGIREREYDLIRALDTVKEIAKDESVDTIFVAGDIFNTSNPDSTSRMGWSQFLVSLINGAVPSLRTAYFVLGNHDCPNNDIKADALKVDNQYVKALNGHEIEIHIAHEIECAIHIDDCGAKFGIILIPYKDDPDFIREKVLALYSEHESEVDHFIIVGHMEIKEAELGANDTKLKCGFSYKDAVFSHKKLVYAALGHIHKPQSFINPESAARIVYSGSPISKDFNEAADWRRVIIGHVSGDGFFDHREVQIPDRDFITIENGEGFEELTGEVVHGSIVKLRFKGTKDELSKFNVASMISKLEAMGALQVKVDRTLLKEIKTDQDYDDFKEVSSIPKACRTYVEKFAPKGLDKERLMSMATSRVKGGK
ncbi:MAG: metallophosphoesterase [Candidatus Izemoplasmatales bacterium]